MSDRIEMLHGAGGRASATLIRELFRAAFTPQQHEEGDDGAFLDLAPGRLVMTTDAHVVSPLFFPGGDIGSLAVHGTVNDLAVMGATPRYLSVAFILEEGLPLADLRRIVASMAAAARAAGVTIVTGDTKVVERGKGDGVFISTTGIGEACPDYVPGGAAACPGDVILLSGTLGDHGLAILSQREGLRFASPIQSDSAALNGLVADLLGAGLRPHVMRDPTRGGVATALNEIAQQSGTGMVLEEAALPLQPAVAAACEFLGLDPLYVANEGKLLAICPPQEAEATLQRMRAHPLGAQAAQIGMVVAAAPGMVRMRTRIGGERMVDWLNGEQLPRIC